MNEKWRMNVNVKGYKTIYSHKSFIDCNYIQIIHF